MDIDTDLPRRKAAAAIISLSDDLSLLSMEELKERIALLRAEIERCETMFDAKQGVQSSAEAIFRKP